MKTPKFIPLLVVVAGLAAYHNSFTGAFVFDDLPSITENITIRHLWPLTGPLTPPHGGGLTVEGRPLINLSLALNYAVGGLNVWGYHAFNLAVHILAALVLYGIVRRTLLTERLRGRFGNAAAGLALAVALIWVVHPLQTEAVTYIVQRAESLMGLCYLLTLYCFMRGAVPGATKLWQVGAVAACAMGMASKEVMISAPIIALLYDRVFVAGSFREAWRRRWPVYLGLGATWMLLGYLVMSTGMLGNQAGEGQAAIWWRYALTELSVIVHYVQLALWPDRLCLDYGWHYGWPLVRTTGDALPGLVIVGAMAVATGWGLWRRSPVGFLGAWFLLILAPTSSVLPLRDLIFEHRMYLSLAAVVTLVVVTGWQLVRTKLAWLGAGSLGLTVLALAAATVTRNLDYRSNLTIWRDSVSKCPGNQRAHYNFGLALEHDGKMEEAKRHYEEALRLKPDYADAHYNLGVVLSQACKLQDASVRFEQALRLRPDLVGAHNNLGIILSLAGKYPEAIKHFEQVLQLRPDYAEAQNNLANVFMQAGKPQEAILHYERALRLKPDYAQAQAGLERARATLGGPASQ